MGSSPVSELRPEQVRASQIFSDGGTAKIDEGRVQKYGAGTANGSLYALIPFAAANMLGIEQGDDLDVYVNVEQGVIIHKIPTDDGLEEPHGDAK